MRFAPLPAALLALAVITSGCGQNRAVLAQQTVQTYWYNLGHLKLRKAYSMLTPGDQVARPYANYSSDIMGFLGSVGSLTVKTGPAHVNNDIATVPVKLYSPKSPKPLPACQHLIWQNGSWLISDQNGALSPASTCSTKA